MQTADDVSDLAAPAAMDVAMRSTRMRFHSIRRWVASAALAVAVAVPGAAFAQVVVVANGSPITAYDIEQRAKLLATSNRKTPTRQEVIQELIDDRIKIAKAKTYGFEVPESEVDQAFGNMAKNQHLSPEQFAQVIERAGISPSTLKARIRAELTWNQLVRGRYSASLEIGESDITKALLERKEAQGDVIGYIYTLYPVMVLVPPGSNAATVEARRHEAENLRGRFVSCKEGLAISRSLRDVAVREPITRSSSDLAPQLRDLLGTIPVGHLTTPEATEQGLQMFALCDKKESKTDSPLKTQVRQEIYAKRFEVESKKFLDEIRKQAMIEYK
jgi:peptidyl-prolyl cis-trans isomerase SurA